MSITSKACLIVGMQWGDLPEEFQDVDLIDSHYPNIARLSTYWDAPLEEQVVGVIFQETEGITEVAASSNVGEHVAKFRKAFPGTNPRMILMRYIF